MYNTIIQILHLGLSHSIWSLHYPSFLYYCLVEKRLSPSLRLSSTCDLLVLRTTKMFLWSAQRPKKIDDCPKSLESNTQEAVASRFCVWPFPETEWCIWSFQSWQSDRSENGLNYNMVLSWQWLRNIFFQGKKVQRREQLRQQASSSLIFTFWGLERLTIQFNRIPQNLLSFSEERFHGWSLQESCLLLGKSWNKIWNSSCLWWLVLKAIKDRRVKERP